MSSTAAFHNCFDKTIILTLQKTNKPIEELLPQFKLIILELEEKCFTQILIKGFFSY